LRDESLKRGLVGPLPEQGPSGLGRDSRLGLVTQRAIGKLRGEPLERRVGDSFKNSLSPGIFVALDEFRYVLLSELIFHLSALRMMLLSDRERQRQAA
jgi:hypothetical protein